ncbi:MAG: methyltransferase domain-containing protein [Magnetococcales bacterium]|nr:methyltransferase domain-containing protein [Magnetococcales bacterium]
MHDIPHPLFSGIVCRMCAEQDPHPLLDFGPQPIAHRILESPAAPEERFPLSVHICPACGLVQNLQPIDPAILYRQYNYCFSSWKPQPHAAEEVVLLKEHLGGGAIFEVGCNDGMFLEKLHQAGFAPVVGVEPNPVAGETARAKGFTVYSSILTEAVCRDAVHRHGRFKAVVIREVLEHIEDLHHAFLLMESMLDEDGVLLIEVPDIGMAMPHGDCSVLWEEHVNFFTRPVLRRLLGMRGFAPIIWRHYDLFSGGVMMVLADRGVLAEEENSAGPTLEQGLAYANQVHQYAERLSWTLRRWREAGGSVVMYGVGARACTVVNALELGRYIDLSVDDQIERQGKFMPGSRLPIHDPRALTILTSPLLVLLAVNSENETRVKERIAALRKDAETLSLCSPTDIRGELASLTTRLESVLQEADATRGEWSAVAARAARHPLSRLRFPHFLADTSAKRIKSA